MRVIVLGGDGFLGWPTAMALAAKGHDVLAVDNYLRRTMAMETRSEPLIPTPNLHDRAAAFEAKSGARIGVAIGSCCDYRFLSELFREFAPDAAIHYAEQPSAPYSMMSYDAAKRTLDNNLSATFNVIWAVKEHAPRCHIVKLGTMGEYGTPNIEIEEGWIEIEHKGRKDKFLFPRAAGSLYHTTKVLDTDLLWFYVRTYGIRVTDLMQGPVYGLETPESRLDPALAPNFHYDDIFGTALNRFLVQAVAGAPLTIYGRGGQTRGYLNLIDTMQCVELAVNNPPAQGEMRILNQFTELFSVNELARRVAAAAAKIGISVEAKSIPNPRKEKEEHFYKARFTGLLELGLRPHPMTDDVLVEMLESVRRHKERIDPGKILPRVRWNAPA
jgi:UDP-sulfoquinovose synthase